MYTEQLLGTFAYANIWRSRSKMGLCIYGNFEFNICYIRALFLRFKMTPYLNSSMQSGVINEILVFFICCCLLLPFDWKYLWCDLRKPVTWCKIDILRYWYHVKSWIILLIFFQDILLRSPLILVSKVADVQKL